MPVTKKLTSFHLAFSKREQMAARIILIVALLTLSSSRALASDPSPLQDFCVADFDSNGRHAWLISQLGLCACTC